METSKLTGAALDWAVTKAEGLSHDFDDEGPTIPNVPRWGCHGWTTSWEMGGPIIEREGIQLRCGLGGWVALPYDSAFSEEAYQEGDTPLVAAMRCYVASRLGDEIEIPEQLVEGE